MEAKQTRNRQPMRITVELTTYGMVQRALFKGNIRNIAFVVAKNPGIEYSAIAEALDTDRQTVACNVAYLVKKGYATITKRSGAINKANKE